MFLNSIYHYIMSQNIYNNLNMYIISYFIISWSFHRHFYKFSSISISLIFFVKLPTNIYQYICKIKPIFLFLIITFFFDPIEWLTLFRSSIKWYKGISTISLVIEAYRGGEKVTQVLHGIHTFPSILKDP